MSAAPRVDRIVEALRKTVQDLSGMDPSRLDPNATFLELGFDSLFLARANGAFKKQFSVRLSTRQLMEKTPTLASLGAYLDQELPPPAFAEAAPPAPPPPPAGLPPVSLAVPVAAAGSAPLSMLSSPSPGSSAV